MKRIFLALFFLTALAGFFMPQEALSQGPAPAAGRVLVYFYSPSCKRCQDIKGRVLPGLTKDYGDKIRIEFRDITQPDDYALLLKLEEKYHPRLDNSVPLFFFEGRFLDPADIHAELKKLLLQPSGGVPQEKAGREGIFYRFLALAPMTVVSAGLIDGINPCAFTVIIFFMSFLAIRGYRRRDLLAIGLAFIVAVFLTYILIGMGLFGFLYRLKGFWLVSNVINIGVGILSILLGVLAVYDYWKFRQSGQTCEMVLQLPGYLKNRIHTIIGSHYRDGAGKGILGLIASALVTGFLVSIIEAVCTGQVYLPTIVFVLKNTSFKLQALGYLLVYNLFFILPLAVIFAFSLAGVTSGQFSRLAQRHMGAVKLLMAVLFFGLGTGLLYSYLSHPASSHAKKETGRGVVAASLTEPPDTYVWNFGEVREGETLKHTFVIKNTSGNTVNITGVRTSCGCTASDVKKKRLAPGESTALDVRFETRGYSGVVKQYVYVNSDNPGSPVTRFIIEADIKK